MSDIRGSATGAGWGWIMAYGIVSVVIGLMAVAWPFAATYAATVVIGAFFFVAGAFSIGAGLFGHGSEGRIYAVVFGLVSLVVGVVMLLEPLTGALSLTLMVAIWLAARGALELYYGFRFRRRRGTMLALGVVNLLLAFFILATVSYSALTLPGFILGISFLFGGVMSIVAAGDHRKGAAAFAVPD